MNITRRDVLKLGASAGALLACGGRWTLAADAKKIPIGLQLYSVRKECAKDLPGVLEGVAKIGYAGVEFAGYHDRKAPELRKLLDANGLKCCGTHTALATLTGDALAATIEFNQTLGNPNLIVPSLPRDKFKSEATLVDTAKLLTELAEKAKASGMRVGYHAHGNDFKPVEGKVPWEVLFDNAGPDVVMQLDIGNCMGGGGDPVAMLKKYPGRSLTIHLKEHGGAKGAVIGEGKAPWTEVFELCETTGKTEWYVVEQESYATDPLGSVKQCFDNLRKMGKC